MSLKALAFFLCTLWLCGFFPVDDPRDSGHGTDVCKKGFGIRRLLILAWSLVLAVYPPLFFLDLFHHTGISEAESDRLSTVMPWFICIASQFVISAIARLFAMVNAGKLVQLIRKMHPLKLNAIDEARDNRVKWRLRHLFWLVYVGLSASDGLNIARHLVKSENPIQGLDLFLLPNVSDTWRTLIYHFIFTTINSTPILLFHFILTFGSDLIQVHQSLCAELCKLLVKGRIARSEKFRTTESYWEVHKQASGLHERFRRMKECFKIYEHLVGAYAFCLVWWIFVAIVTVFSSVTAGGLPKAHVLNYGIWSVAFIYMVASFGDYMTRSVDQGTEVISDTLSEVGGPKYFEDETQVMTVTIFQ